MTLCDGGGHFWAGWVLQTSQPNPDQIRLHTRVIGGVQQLAMCGVMITVIGAARYSDVNSNLRSEVHQLSPWILYHGSMQTVRPATLQHQVSGVQELVAGGILVAIMGAVSKPVQT